VKCKCAAQGSAVLGFQFSGKLLRVVLVSTCSRGLLVASLQRILEFLLSSIKLWRKLASSVEVFVLVSAHSRMMLLRFSQRILLLHSLLVVIDQALEKVGFVTSIVKQMSKHQL
jgi:hypothetical protein